jgi:hypothetical protein
MSKALVLAAAAVGFSAAGAGVSWADGAADLPPLIEEYAAPAAPPAVYVAPPVYAAPVYRAPTVVVVPAPVYTAPVVTAPLVRSQYMPMRPATGAATGMSGVATATGGVKPCFC